VAPKWGEDFSSALNKSAQGENGMPLISSNRMSTTWPPFERAQWDERARSMLSSLSKMMQEHCETPAGAVNSCVGESLRRCFHHGLIDSCLNEAGC